MGRTSERAGEVERDGNGHAGERLGESEVHKVGTINGVSKPVEYFSQPYASGRQSSLWAKMAGRQPRNRARREEGVSCGAEGGYGRRGWREGRVGRRCGLVRERDLAGGSGYARKPGHGNASRATCAEWSNGVGKGGEGIG